MPSPRKRPEQRSGKSGRTRDIGQIARRTDVAVIVPQCPATLAGREPLASTVEAWERLWSSDVAAVLELDSDMESVVRWLSLLDERERTFRAFRQKRMVEGSTGQPVLSPLWQVVQSCDRELRALEDRIGLSPRARLNLGITYAEAGKSLDELNRLLERDDSEAPTEDPRLRTIESVPIRG